MRGLEVTWKSLLALAIPSMASSLLNNLYRVVDQYFVQWIGTPAQAALSSSTFVLIAAYALFILVSAGAGPLIARRTGEGNQEGLERTIRAAISAAFVASLFFSTSLMLAAEPIASSLGGTEESLRALETYLFWLGASGWMMAFGPVIDTIYISQGDTKTPMKLQMLSTALNASLNALFIFGFQWGIAGAALASGISRAITSGIGLWLLGWQRPLYCKYLIAQIIRIGNPAAMGVVTYALVYWVIIRTAVSPLGESVNAALGVGFSALEGVAWPLYAGIMTAVSSLIGRQLGSGDIKGTQRTIVLSFRCSSTIGLSCAAIFWWAAIPICSFFTEDPMTLEQAVLYARVLALSQVFVAWEAMAEGVLSGAGDNKSVFWASFPWNLARIPLAIWLSTAWGAVGIWWAINLTTYAKASIKLLLVAKGKWQELEL